MRGTWIALAGGIAMAFAAGSAVAEEKVPRPGPETERLGYFAGKWKTTGELKETPFGPGGKFAATEQCEWFPGKWSLVCRSKGKGPVGPTQGLGVMSYSQEEKAYVYFGIDSGPMVMTSVPRGTFADGTYTYDDESRMGGKPVKSRYVIHATGPRTYESTWSIQGPDGQYQVVMTATSKKE